MESKLRKYRNNLIIGGRGLIAFGMWNTFKVVLSFFTGDVDLRSQLDDAARSLGEAEGSASPFAVAVVVLGYLLATLPILAVYLYTGVSAYKEGMCIKKRTFYLVIAAFMIITNAFEIVIYMSYIAMGEADKALSSFPSILIDGTTLLLLVDIMYSAVMSRRLSKGA